MCHGTKANSPVTPIGESCLHHADQLHRFLMPGPALILNSGTLVARCACNMEFSLVFRDQVTVAQLALLFWMDRSKVGHGRMTLRDCVTYCEIYRNDITEFKFVYFPPDYLR